MTNKAYYHLPGLFEFYDLYTAFLPIFREHRDYFYDWCEIGSVYGAPARLHMGRRTSRLRRTFSTRSPRPYERIQHLLTADLQQFPAKRRTPFRQKVQRALQAVFPKPASTKWCDNMLRPASFISERELSPPLFCVLYHKSPYRVFSACKRA